MTRKGIYPYSYFDSWDKFNEGYLPEKREEMDDYGYILEVDLGKLHSLSLLHSSAHISHIFDNFKFNQSIIISNLATTQGRI